MISNAKINIMGTVSFMGKFGKMRKAQDFIVYPMKEQAEVARIQADSYSGFIELASGKVVLIAGGYFVGNRSDGGVLPAEELLMFKAKILESASPKAGRNGVAYCDNSAAVNVFNV